MIEESRVPFLRRPRMKPELANGDGVSEGGRTGVTHGAPLRCVQLPAGGAHVRPGGSVGTRVRRHFGRVGNYGQGVEVYSQEEGDRDIIHSLLRRWKDLTNASSLEG